MTTSANNLSGISRREFFHYSWAASLLCLMPCGVALKPAWSAAPEDYYVVHGERFRSSFATTVDAAEQYLIGVYGKKSARQICREAKAQFARLLPGLPFIGGEKHPGTKWVLLAGHWLSFYRPMQAMGCYPSETGRLMYDLYVDYLDTIPPREMRDRGAKRWSQAYRDAVKKWADNKNRRYEEDFLADFISGDGRDFDFGIDYLRCPCERYFKTHQAEALAPYFCLLDFPEHKRMGTGLVRTRTLAQGDAICDFRFKKGREVRQDWFSEVPKFPSVSIGKG